MKSKSKSKSQRSKTKRKSRLNGGHRKTKRKSRLNGGHIFNSRLLRSCSLDPPTVKFIKAYEQAGKSLDKDKHKQRFIQEDSQVLVDYLSIPNDCENERDALKRIIELFSNSNKDAFYGNYGAADENDNSQFTLAYLKVIKSLESAMKEEQERIDREKAEKDRLDREKAEKDANIQRFVSGDIDIDTMKEMMKSGNITDINVRNKSLFDYTALIYKTSYGTIDQMEWLLDNGANVDLQDSYGMSAIYHAIFKNDVAKVQLLLTNNPDLNISNKSGDTPLAYAKMYKNDFRYKNDDIISILEKEEKEEKQKYLGECGQRLATVDISPDKKNKLCNAIIGIDDSAADDTTEHDDAIQKWKEFTHIIFNDDAILEEIYKTIKSDELCFLHEIEINIKIDDKIDPETVTDEKLFYIIKNVGKDNYKLTTQFNPELYYETNIEKCQHKYMAIPIGHSKHSNMLIIHKDEKNIKVEHFEPHGDSFSSDDLEMNKKINKYIDRLVYSLFVRNGYTKEDIEIIHPEQLCKLNKSRHNKLQQLLSGTEFDGTCTIFSMWYSFYRLLYPSLSSEEVYRQMNNRLERSTNRTETIKMIIQTFLSLIKINIDDYTISGERKLDSYSKNEIKKIRNIVEPNSKDNIKRFVRGDLATMKEMMDSGNITDINVRDKDIFDYTALMYKIGYGTIDQMKWLLGNGANVDLQESDSWSAIFFAIYNNDVAKVKLLLEYNPDLNIKNKSGDTPLTFARMLNRNEIIRILEKR